MFNGIITALVGPSKAGIGERGNSVYGMRAPGYGGKGEDGKAKAQW